MAEEMGEDETKKTAKEWKITGKNLIARRTTKLLIEDALLTRFEDEKTRQERTRKDFFARKVEELLILRTQQRDIIFDRFHASMHKAKLKEQYAIAIQRALRASWHNILGLEFFAEEERIRMKSKLDKITHFNKEESEAAAKDIAAFEKITGFELGAEEPAPAAGAKKLPPAKKPPPAKKLSKTAIKPDEAPAIDPQVLEEKVNAYIKDIKERKTKEFAEKSEILQKQRQKLLQQQEQQRVKDEEEAKRKAEEDAVIQAAAEAEEAEQKRILVVEQKAEQDRRLVQEQELAAKRSAEWDLIRVQEHECFMMYYNDITDTINQEYNEWQEEIQEKRRKRRKKHFDFCYDIILQFVSMAECINEYHAEVGKNLPVNDWRQWKNLFIKGAILPVVLPRPPPPAELPTEKEIRLAKEEVEAYMNEKEEYRSPENVEPIGKNKHLGQFLVNLDELADSLAEPFAWPDLTKFTLKLSVVGGSGKNVVAKHLEAEYGILRIEVQQVQTLAVTFGTSEEERVRSELAGQATPNVEAEDKNEHKTEDVLAEALANLPPKARLGLQAKSAIDKKEPVPDDIIAQLVLLTMLNPEEYVAPVSLDPPAAVKDRKPAAKTSPPKKPSLKGGKGASPPVAATIQQSGFILQDFPQTGGQAAALEKCLTGFDIEAQKAKQAKASKIAPPPEPETEKKQESGLDTYLMLEPTPEDEVMKLVLESAVDPNTGIVYHPQRHPVPMDDTTGIAERLQPLDTEVYLRERVTAEAEKLQSLQTILSKFGNVHSVPRNWNEAGVWRLDLKMVIETIATFINTKAKEGATSGAMHVAKEAVTAAREASKEVVMARKAAEDLAKVFFETKLAEIEAEQSPVVDAGASPDPKAAKGKPPPPTEKPSGAIAKMLDEVTKAIQEAEIAETDSKAAAVLAQKHAEDSQAAQTVEGGPEVANLCKEKASQAAEVAKQAAMKAAAASQKATDLLQTVKNLAEGKAVIPPPKADKGKAPPPPPAAKGAKGPEKAEVQEPPAPPPPVVKPPIDPEVEKIVKIADILNKRWQELEENYLQTLQDGFRLLIRERQRTIPLLIEAKRNFADLLIQLNGKQELFENFQERYNRIELPQRRERAMQRRLYEEGARFAEVLRALCSERLENGKETEQRTLEDLLEERTATFTSLFTLLVQAELDRHLESCGLVHEYYSKKVGSNFAKQFRCSLSTSRRQPTWRFMTPKWLPPLEGSYPEFHVVLCEALAKACNMLEVIAGRAGSGMKMQPRRPQTRRMSGCRNTWMRVTDPTFREHIPLDSSVPPIIAREQQIFYNRLELLARIACKYLEEVQPVCDGAYGCMDEWLMRRCDAESELVEEVVSVVEDAIRECIPLWYRVWMELDTFQVDENEITQIVHVPPEPIIDLTPWHILVMESLIAEFKKFKGGFATTRKVIDAALAAIDEVYMMWRNDPEHNIYNRLPLTKSRRYGHFQHWANLAYDIIEQSTGEKEPGYTFVIEWRGFLVSLADAHFDYPISAATIDDIVQARTDFFMVVATKQPGDQTLGCITLEDFLNTKIWFNVESGEESEDEDSEVESAKNSVQKYDFPAALKKFIFSVAEKEAKNSLPWQTLLLYLCRDPSYERALRKAFTVLATTMAPDEAQLSPTELIQALYPSGVDGAMEAGCITWTTDDMMDVLFRAGIEKVTPHVEPQTVPSYVSSDPEMLPSEKDTVSLFLASQTSSQMSQMSEPAAETIREFLLNVPDSVPSTITPVTPWQESEHELEFAPQPPIPEKLTVEDCVRLNATAKLCGALSATFQQHSVHVMHVAPEEFY